METNNEAPVSKGRKTGKWIMNFLGVGVTSVCFTIIFITFMVSIISRYVFRVPVAWSYEISVLGYMWTMFFGVGKAMEKDEHVVFSLVYDSLQPRGQYICKVIYNILLAVLLSVAFVPCIQSMLKKKNVTGVLQMPHAVVFAPFIYMLAEVIVRSIINVFKAKKEYELNKGKVTSFQDNLIKSAIDSTADESIELSDKAKAAVSEMEKLGKSSGGGDKSAPQAGNKSVPQAKGGSAAKKNKEGGKQE